MPTERALLVLDWIEHAHDDIIAAVTYCRLGRARPRHERAFYEAKRLGLLAQDPCWRATDHGIGALVARGLLDGTPAPRRTSLCVLWAVCERYPTPQFVGAWPEWTWEHLDTDEVKDDWLAHGEERGWHFFSIWHDLDQPAVPGQLSEDPREFAYAA